MAKGGSAFRVPCLADRVRVRIRQAGRQACRRACVFTTHSLTAMVSLTRKFVSLMMPLANRTKGAVVAALMSSKASEMKGIGDGRGNEPC